MKIHVNLNAIAANLALLQHTAGSSRLMAVIKSDAYGHGAQEVIAALALADGVAVVTVNEGIYIRQRRTSGPVFVLQGYLNAHEARLCRNYQLTPILHTLEQIDVAAASDHVIADCWIKIDTGMSRLGFHPDQLNSVRQRLECSGVRVAGLMTHLAGADVHGAAT